MPLALRITECKACYITFLAQTIDNFRSGNPEYGNWSVLRYILVKSYVQDTSLSEFMPLAPTVIDAGLLYYILGEIITISSLATLNWEISRCCDTKK